MRLPSDPSDWNPTNTRAWSGLSAHPLKYSRMGPPLIMPLVARTMHGSTSSMMFARMSEVSTRLNIGERNGFSPVWKICVRSWEFRYSGYAVWIAVASQIIPSRYTGAWGIWPVRIASSRTSMTSWDRPTANTGTSTFPPRPRTRPRMLRNCAAASWREGWMSWNPPYVDSSTRVSRRGNLFTAGLKSHVFSNLMSPLIATLYRPSPMWKWATAEPRMWPAFWNVRRTSGAMSVVSPYFSGIVFATAFRMLLESYADLRASPIATLMKSSWRRDMRSRVGGVV